MPVPKETSRRGDGRNFQGSFWEDLGVRFKERVKQPKILG